MKHEIILKNGVLIDPKNQKFGRLDIGIDQGKVTAVSEELNEAHHIIDAKGRYVMPGIIDIHMHTTRLLGGPLGYKMMAETGVTTAIDFAGPFMDIVEDLPAYGSGLNVGGIEGIIPGLSGRRIKTDAPSTSTLEEELEISLNGGALGIKLMGGHYPLTPEATENAMAIANNRKAIVAFHAGSKASKSDMTGMREAIELAKNKRLLLAHINAYCRGNVDHPLEELKEALQLLMDNPNVYPESHMAVINGTSGYCETGIPKSGVTKMSLYRLGFEVTEEGLEEAIRTGFARVHKEQGGVNHLVQYEEALLHWKQMGTDTGLSFPMNLPTIAVGCAVERVKPGGDFIIPIQSTDGGGIPRNNLLTRMHSLVKLDYLSLEEMVEKISGNPAKMFGLNGKGHLGVGADADITVFDGETSAATLSLVGGKVNMKDGLTLQDGGTLLCTEEGVETAKRKNLPYTLANIANSTMYQ
ncbi:amidohydrolase family protein [Geomicrobium sp. JSM 1781026]|uniref:amidohydrolase family protein n=1 Tax=Geomicrobium sp. JSM 1781026 TaxID=3344580 RepID=UPI0035C1ADDA